MAAWTEDTFMNVVNKQRKLNPDWRYGQTLFNVLQDFDPVLADMIRGMDCDPFYATKMFDPRIQRFFVEVFGKDQFSDE